MKCPLNHQDLEAPLENITAQTLRECVKTFEGLDYSPEEANIATDLAAALAKNARLGFTEVRFSCLSEKMTRYLESKGIHVVPVWRPQIISKVQEMHHDCGVHFNQFTLSKRRHRCHSGKESELTKFLSGEIPEPVASAIQTETLIGWGELPPVIDNGRFFSDRDKAIELSARNLDLHKKRDVSLLDEMREAIKPEELIEFKADNNSKPANTGCLPLLIACPAAIWGILNLF